MSLIIYDLYLKSLPQSQLSLPGDTNRKGGENWEGVLEQERVCDENAPWICGPVNETPHVVQFKYTIKQKLL